MPSTPYTLVTGLNGCIQSRPRQKGGGFVLEGLDHEVPELIPVTPVHCNAHRHILFQAEAAGDHTSQMDDLVQGSEVYINDADDSKGTSSVQEP